MGDLFKNLFGGKSWYESLTGWGVVIFLAGSAGLEAACSQGLLSADICATASHAVDVTSGILVTLGIRKATQQPAKT